MTPFQGFSGVEAEGLHRPCMSLDATGPFLAQMKTCIHSLLRARLCWHCLSLSSCRVGDFLWFSGCRSPVVRPLPPRPAFPFPCWFVCLFLFSCIPSWPFCFLGCGGGGGQGRGDCGERRDCHPCLWNLICSCCHSHTTTTLTSLTPAPQPSGAVSNPVLNVTSP